MVAAAPTANAAPPSNARREIVSASRMMILPFLYARFRPLLRSAVTATSAYFATVTSSDFGTCHKMIW